MRKLAVLILALALIVVGFSVPRSDAQLNPTLWLSPQLNYVPTGSGVIVEVKLTDAPFSFGMSLHIGIDNQYLEIDPESVVEGEYYRQDGAPTIFNHRIVKDKTNPNIDWLIVGASRFNDRVNTYGPIAGDGLVFYFVAKCKFVGEAAMIVRNAKMINLRYQQGEVFIDEVPLKVEEAYCNCVAKDNEPPKVTITKSPLPETNQHIGKFEWSGYDDSTPPESIQFSYKLEDPIAGGTWSEWGYRTNVAVTFLREGKNCFYVKARDERGNESTPQSVCITYDITPPKLELQPVPPEVYDPEFQVCGETDPPEDGVSLRLNGAMVPLNAQGQFCQTMRLFLGTNTIHASAIDKAGNIAQKYFTINYVERTKIIMQVGNPNSTINGVPTVIDPPPMIISGRTMVPLRFLSEAFGMNIEWIASSRQIDIKWTETVGGQRISHYMKMWPDKKIYNLDGKAMSLDVPAQIVNGRTLVPLRFVGEAFGAEFEWDGTTRTVTVIYTKR